MLQSSTKETLMDIVAEDSTPTSQKQPLATSLAEPELGRPSLHVGLLFDYFQYSEVHVKRLNNGPFMLIIQYFKQDLEDEQSMSEPTLLERQRKHRETKIAIEVPQKMNITFGDDVSYNSVG